MARRRGAIFGAAALILMTLPAAAGEAPTRAELEVLLRPYGVTDLRGIGIFENPIFGWQVGIDYNPQLVEPGLCLYKAGTAFLRDGDEGHAVVQMTEPVLEASLSSCDEVRDNAQKRIVLGNKGTIAVKDLVLAVHVARSVLDHADPPVRLRFATPDLVPILANATLADVFEISDGHGITVYFAPYSGDPVGIRFPRHASGHRSVYVFLQREQLED